MKKKPLSLLAPHIVWTLYHRNNFKLHVIIICNDHEMSEHSIHAVYFAKL